jgi:hypothetical protein
MCVDPMTGLPYPGHTEPWHTPGWPYAPGPGEPYYPPTFPPTFPPYYPPMPVYPQAQLCPVCMGSGKLAHMICHGCGGKGWVVVGFGTLPNVTITYSTGGRADACR